MNETKRMVLKLSQELLEERKLVGLLANSLETLVKRVESNPLSLPPAIILPAAVLSHQLLVEIGFVNGRFHVSQGKP